MLGELGAVWPLTWKEIWVPLMRHAEFGNDLTKDLYREHVEKPTTDLPATELSETEFQKLREAAREYEDTAANVDKARSALRRECFSKEISEATAVKFLESSYSIFEEYDNPNYANQYFNRVDNFIKQYSLRYDLRRPLTLHPTLSGIFSSLIKELRRISAEDAHLQALLEEFEESIRDLRTDLSQGRVKTCLQKQFNLLEAIGRNFPGVTQQTLGAMCGQIDTWPHATIRDALRTLYGFRSDYPGLGHAGNPAAALRDLDARDIVAIGVMLAGFVPYLSNTLDARLIYGA